MGNVIIIGTGPAGISAALYTARAGIETTVIGKGTGALEKAGEIENYYGFPQPVTGRELVENGIAQAKRVGAEIITDEVVGLGFTDKLTVKTATGAYAGDCIVLTTGSSRKTPKIKGVLEYEGKGVSYCAVCDGFFHRGKDVAVLGSGEYALSEAQELLPVANSVTLITNGAEPTRKIPPVVNIITTQIQEIRGGNILEKVVFRDGTEIQVSGVFIAVGVAGSSDLAKKIGVATDGDTIIIDGHMATNIPGIYAAGDCTGGMLQVAKAVYQGAVAGTEVVKTIRGLPE